MTVRQQRVLVLDDEENIRESLAGYLEDCGFEVLPAESAEDALGQKTLDEVGVAIVDIRLGGMDGLSFIKQVHGQFPHMHFLIHTGSTEFQLDQELRGLGMTDSEVLYKPVLDMSVFERLIATKMTEPRP